MKQSRRELKTAGAVDEVRVPEVGRLWRRHCPTGDTGDGLMVVSADGRWLVDAAGRRFLDCAGGGARPLGWTHPVLTNVEVPVVGSGESAVWPESAELAAALAEATPGGTNRRVLLCQSGREALARGIELARNVTGRNGVLYLSGAAGLDSSRVANAAAIVVHPFDTRLAAARAAADRSGAWLIDDETRIAPGTTGRMLAVEHSGVRPDLYVLGPGAAAGLSFGAAITGSSKHCWREGADGPSRAACAAGLRYFGLLKSGLVDRGVAIGARIERAAVDRPDWSPGKWFGTGTHWTLVFGNPGPDIGRLVAACRQRGLLVDAVGAASVAFRPALTITDSELEAALDAVAGAVKDAARRRSG